MTKESENPEMVVLSDHLFVQGETLEALISIMEVIAELKEEIAGLPIQKILEGQPSDKLMRMVVIRNELVKRHNKLGEENGKTN